MVAKICMIVFSIVFIIFISSTVAHADDSNMSEVPGWLDTTPSSADMSVIYGTVGIIDNTSGEVLVYDDDSNVLINRIHGMDSYDSSYSRWYRVEVKRNSTVRLESPGSYVEHDYPCDHIYSIIPSTINATEPSVRHNLNVTIMYAYRDEFSQSVIPGMSSLATSWPIALISFILAVYLMIMRRIDG